MNIFEQIYNIVWIFLGIWICIQSLYLKIWGASGPETGFITFGAGLFIGLCGILLFVSESSKGPRDPNESFWEHPNALKRIICVLIGFFTMALFMPILGFFITSVPVMFFLVWIVEPQKFIRAIFAAILSCSFIYFLFDFIFDIHLPKGLLNF